MNQSPITQTLPSASSYYKRPSIEKVPEKSKKSINPPTKILNLSATKVRSDKALTAGFKGDSISPTMVSNRSTAHSRLFSQTNSTA